jgi:hypothetical protein
MKNLVEKILDRKFEDAGKIFENAMVRIVGKKLSEEKKRIAAECSCDGGYDRRKMLAKDVLEDKEDPKSTSGTEQEVSEDAYEKNLPPISQDGVDPARTAKLASMARGEPAKPSTTTQADKEKATQFEEIQSGEESSMARSELASISKNAKSIMSKIKGNKELEAWTQSKITKAADYMTSVSDYMDGQKLDEARINLIKARIRGGKIQRRKKVSNVPGFTLRAGQLTRMSAAERRHRKLGAKRAARKTKMKKTQVLRKRKLSLQKRKRLGI